MAQVRNKLMVDIADQITVGYGSKGGNIEALLTVVEKPVEYIVSAGKHWVSKNLEGGYQKSK